MKKLLFTTALVTVVLVLTSSCAVDAGRNREVSAAPSSSRDNFGQTPPTLADLVGARAGQAEAAVMQRGYEMRGGSKSADSSYTNWEELSSGECVTIQTKDGRYESIIYGSKLDCESSSDATAGGSDDQFGQTPPALADLVGARAGQAEGALMQRGYEMRGGSKSEDSSYTNWEEMDTGECVTIRTKEGRYESIIYGSRADCN